MTMELAVDILRNLLQTALILSIPILGTALTVGLLGWKLFPFVRP